MGSLLIFYQYLLYKAQVDDVISTHQVQVDIGMTEGYHGGETELRYPSTLWNDESHRWDVTNKRCIIARQTDSRQT